MLLMPEQDVGRARIKSRRFWTRLTASNGIWRQHRKRQFAADAAEICNSDGQLPAASLAQKTITYTDEGVREVTFVLYVIFYA